MNIQDLAPVIEHNVRVALEEDIGSGDITAQLIPENTLAHGRVITRESAVVSGRPWVEEVFRQLDPQIRLDWQVKDGDRVEPNSVLFYVEGPARSLLTGERAALNFLQTLSGTATLCRELADLVAHTRCRILDTRKTLPGLRLAQKYAVTCGGCYNHRLGLYDAFLIKENHIQACGSITAAIATAHRQAPGKPVEVEVETMDELAEAIAAGADIIMLDDFSLEDTLRAVHFTQGRAKLEASGGISRSNLVQIAETGVDYISMGTLTKDCKSIDLSMRLEG